MVYGNGTSNDPIAKANNRDSGKLAPGFGRSCDFSRFHICNSAYLQVIINGLKLKYVIL